MAVLDINNTEIVAYSDFPNNNEIRNLEIGASRNCFGKKYYPSCYSTDLAEPSFPHFQRVIDYNENNAHFLDHIGDFYNLQFTRDFDLAIFCNPYGFGFRGREESKRFLNKSAQVLRSGGEILILGNNANDWSKYSNAEKWLSRLNDENILDFKLELSPLTLLDENHTYRMNHVFRKMTVDDTTVVHQMYKIVKQN
jgi:SAM-dependent methyltransferase